MVNIIQKEDLGSDFTNDNSLALGGVGVDKTQLVTIGSGAPSGAPAAGDPLDYYDNSGTPWVQYRWDGSAWQPVSFNYENWLLSNLPAAPETLTPRPNVYIDDSVCPAMLNFWDPCADSNNGAYVQVPAAEPPVPAFINGDTMLRVTAVGRDFSNPVAQFNGMRTSPLASPNPQTNVLVVNPGGSTSTMTADTSTAFGLSPNLPDNGWMFLDYEFGANSNFTNVRAAVSGSLTNPVSALLDLAQSGEQLDVLVLNWEQGGNLAISTAFHQLSASGEYLVITRGAWDNGNTLEFDGGGAVTGTVDLNYTATDSSTFDVIEWPSGFVLYIRQDVNYTLT